MSAMASRTLLVDPTEDQKKAYMIASDALDTLISHMTVGQPISSAYMAAKNLVMQRNADLSVPANMGFGIGFNYKERALTVSAQNETIIESGMTFHVRIALQGVSKVQARSIVAIGDTIIVQAAGPNKVLTAGIQKAYAEISYSLEESEPAAQAKEETKQTSVAKTDSKQKPAEEKKSKKGKKVTSSEEEASYSDDEASGEEGSQEILKAGKDLDFQKSTRLRSKADNQLDK